MSAHARFVRTKLCAPDPPEGCCRLVLELLAHSGRVLSVEGIYAIQQGHREAQRAAQDDDELSTADYLTQPSDRPLWDKLDIAAALRVLERIGAAEQVTGGWQLKPRGDTNNA